MYCLTTDFIGEIEIHFSSLGVIESAAKLGRYSYVETEILVELLGYDLYKSFVAGIAEIIPAQKWLDLRDGKDYQVTNKNGQLVYIKWGGIREMLKYFVYAEYKKMERTTAVVNGETKNNYQNGESANDSFFLTKYMNAYNKGVYLYGINLEEIEGSYSFLKQTVQKANTNRDYFVEMLKPTAYNFIYFANIADATTYPNWQFTSKININHLGI